VNNTPVINTPVINTTVINTPVIIPELTLRKQKTEEVKIRNEMQCVPKVYMVVYTTNLMTATASSGSKWTVTTAYCFSLQSEIVSVPATTNRDLGQTWQATCKSAYLPIICILSTQRYLFLIVLTLF